MSRGRGRPRTRPDNYSRRWHGEAVAKLRKEVVVDYFVSHPCVDCGEADPVVLEFDHVRGEKVMNVSNMVGRLYEPKRIMNEIEKCDVRCANCHKRRHFKERAKEDAATAIARTQTDLGGLFDNF